MCLAAYLVVLRSFSLIATRSLGSRDPLATSTRQPESPGSSPSPNGTADENSLYCMVPFIWTPKYLPSYHAIRATWGKRCDRLTFMIDPVIGDEQVGFFNMTSASDARAARDANLSLPGDVIVLHGMRRPWHSCGPEKGDCRNIWEKVWRSWLWVDESGGSDSAGWFVKADADTFLFPENAKRYVEGRGWSPGDHHYFGHKLHHTDRPGQAPIVAGAAAFLSRATAKALASSFRGFETNPKAWDHTRCMDVRTASEEVLTAVCLKRFNVTADPALDDMGNELISIGAVEEALLWKRGNRGMTWYWKKKPKTHPRTGTEMHLCCGSLPIAFHGYKDAQWLYKIANELYADMVDFPGASDDWKRYNWSNPEQTHRYFDRVRKAMFSSHAYA